MQTVIDVPHSLILVLVMAAVTRAAAFSALWYLFQGDTGTHSISWKSPSRSHHGDAGSILPERNFFYRENTRNSGNCSCTFDSRTS